MQYQWHLVSRSRSLQHRLARREGQAAWIIENAPIIHPPVSRNPRIWGLPPIYFEGEVCNCRPFDRTGSAQATRPVRSVRPCPVSPPTLRPPVRAQPGRPGLSHPPVRTWNADLLFPTTSGAPTLQSHILGRGPGFYREPEFEISIAACVRHLCSAANQTRDALHELDL